MWHRACTVSDVNVQRAPIRNCICGAGLVSLAKRIHFDRFELSQLKCPRWRSRSRFFRGENMHPHCDSDSAIINSIAKPMCDQFRCMFAYTPSKLGADIQHPLRATSRSYYCCLPSSTVSVCDVRVFVMHFALKLCAHTHTVALCECVSVHRWWWNDNGSPGVAASQFPNNIRRSIATENMNSTHSTRSSLFCDCDSYSWMVVCVCVSASECVDACICNSNY